MFTVDEWPRSAVRLPHLLGEMPADHLAQVREMRARRLGDPDQRLRLAATPAAHPRTTLIVPENRLTLNPIS